MESMQLDGEVSIYDAVKHMNEAELKSRVQKNARNIGFELEEKHIKVILALVKHYQDICETTDCLSATKHMRFLNNAFESEGGSKYLYRLFDQGSSVGAGGSEVGVLTRIHELAGLPELTNNIDDGFGTSI